MEFSEKDGHDTGSNQEHFRDVTVNPLNPGSIYLFPATGERIFHEIFIKRQTWHNK